MNEVKCSICGAVLKLADDGYNAYPIRPSSNYGDEQNRCCRKCNNRYVVPARICLYRMSAAQQNEEIAVLMNATKQELDGMFGLAEVYRMHCAWDFIDEIEKKRILREPF